MQTVPSFSTEVAAKDGGVDKLKDDQYNTSDAGSKAVQSDKVNKSKE